MLFYGGAGGVPPGTQSYCKREEGYSATMVMDKVCGSKCMPGRLRKVDRLPSSAKSRGVPTLSGNSGCISQRQSAICRANSKSCVERKMVFRV